MIYAFTNSKAATRGLLRSTFLIPHPALRAAMSRLLMALPLLFVATALSFVLLALVPGDPARQMLGMQAPEQSVLQLRHTLGLDRPVVEQYWTWLDHAVHGDLGASIVTGESVTQALDERLPVTLSLILGTMLVAILVGIPLGVVSAIRGGALGRLLDTLAIGAFALPSFWLGAALIALFAVRLNWFPAVGYVPLTQSPTAWLQSLVLPVMALATYEIAVIAKQTRAAMLDALSSEYIRAAWASGIAPWSIVWRHAFRNAAIVVLTVLGLEIIGLLGGTIFVEAVFGLPGLGSLAATAAQDHDFPIIQGVVLYFTVIVVTVNLVVDVAYSWLNPRVSVT